MALIIFFLQMSIAAFLVYHAFRDESLRENSLLLGAAFVSFIGLTGGWIYLFLYTQSHGISHPYAFAIIFVLGMALPGIIWGFFWGLVCGQGAANFFVRLIAGEGGTVVKQYSKAVAAEINAQYPEAISFYSQYLQEDPGDYIAMERIARCYYNLKIPQEAITSLHVALQLLNSSRIPKKQKREEAARLLFLQNVIAQKFQLPLEPICEQRLMGEFPHTKFGSGCLRQDPLLATYLQVWGDCQRAH
jgi:tetratricopeptide (TPR) repeat protein